MSHLADFVFAMDLNSFTTVSYNLGEALASWGAREVLSFMGESRVLGCWSAGEALADDSKCFSRNSRCSKAQLYIGSTSDFYSAS